MNIKLSLLITLAALSNNIHAETVRERLNTKLQITKAQFSHNLNEYNSPSKNQVDEIFELGTRQSLLEAMLDCIDKYEQFHIDKDGQLIAALCSADISNTLNEQYKYHSNKKFLELTLKELKKINQEENLELS